MRRKPDAALCGPAARLLNQDSELLIHAVLRSVIQSFRPAEGYREQKNINSVPQTPTTVTPLHKSLNQDKTENVWKTCWREMNYSDSNDLFGFHFLPKLLFLTCSFFTYFNKSSFKAEMCNLFLVIFCILHIQKALLKTKSCYLSTIHDFVRNVSLTSDKEKHKK